MDSTMVPKPVKEKLEKEISKEIYTWLKSREFFCWRMPGGMAGKYLEKGIADIFVLHNGHLIALEIKRPGNLAVAHSNRQEQLEWGKKCNAAGGFYSIVRSLEEVQMIFELAL